MAECVCVCALYVRLSGIVSALKLCVCVCVCVYLEECMCSHVRAYSIFEWDLLFYVSTLRSSLVQ